MAFFKKQYTLRLLFLSTAVVAVGCWLGFIVLPRLRTTARLRLLAELIRDASSSTHDVERAFAFDAIERSGRSGVRILIEILDDKNPRNRETAARVLGGMKAIASPAVPRLLLMRWDTDGDVREAVNAAISAIRAAQNDPRVSKSKENADADILTAHRIAHRHQGTYREHRHPHFNHQGTKTPTL